MFLLNPFASPDFGDAAGEAKGGNEKNRGKDGAKKSQ